MAVRFSEDEIGKILKRGGYRANDQSAPRQKPTPAAPASSIARAEKKPSKLEIRFDQQLTASTIPAPIANYLFLPNRDLELDRAWPQWKLGVEINGGAHRASMKMLDRDCEKICLALLAGWWILPFSRELIRSERSIEILFAAIEQRRRMRPCQQP